MSKNDDGGAAFPGKAPLFDLDGDGLGLHEQGGMSRRDYFAGQALVGMLGNPMYDENSSANVAQQAVMQADAMLKALNA